MFQKLQTKFFPENCVKIDNRIILTSASFSLFPENAGWLLGRYVVAARVLVSVRL